MSTVEHNFSEKERELIGIDNQDVNVQLDETTYARMCVYDPNDVYLTSFDTLPDTNNVLVYSFENEKIFIKPNDSLQSATIETGQYRLKFDVLQSRLLELQLATGFTNLKFLVTEISPTRKEIRVELRRSVAQEGSFPVQLSSDYQNDISKLFNNVPLEYSYLGAYNFDHVVILPQGYNATITNYAFDTVSDPDNPTLVIKFSEPIPNTLAVLDFVDVAREVVDTTYEDIFYDAALYNEVVVYDGLDSYEGLLPVDSNQQQLDPFQSSADLTGSFSNNSIQQLLISGSDVNLNINYNHFENHIFFGSAVTRLDNFKTKVSSIEDKYLEISKSLGYADHVSMSGDSTFVTERRENLFKEVQNTISTLTPYEKFLYYDNQSLAESTSSAPGLGINLTTNTPVSLTHIEQTLEDFEGFGTVYKVSTAPDTGSNGELTNGLLRDVPLFSDLYYAQKKPFFSDSGSIYLSFLLKGDSFVGSDIENTKLTWRNKNNTTSTDHLKAPEDTLHTSSILAPSITGSRWSRFIFEASQSYWRPIENRTVGGGGNPVFNFEAGSSQVEILSGSNVSGSYPIQLYGNFYSALGTTITGSGKPFTGSVAPSGELFNVSFPRSVDSSGNPIQGQAPDSHTSVNIGTHYTASLLTDVKVTTNNPLNVLPFSHLYSTSSAEFSNWFDGMRASASAYDEANIHSLENNLPRFIRDSEESTEIKLFVNMIAEHFDIIRNYIDNYSSLNKRNYTKLESVPTNLLPILADQLGWELISPYTGSMSEYFGTSEQDNQVGSGLSVQEITNNTWRKVVNNLIYIYKTKGTMAGIRALLNTYGYPPDAINIAAQGTSNQNPFGELDGVDDDDVNKQYSGVGGSKGASIITNSPNQKKSAISDLPGNISFTQQQEDLFSYQFDTSGDYSFGSSWYTLDKPINTLEFIARPISTHNTQSMVASSGSLGERFWDLIIKPSGSGYPEYGAVEFRISTIYTGSTTGGGGINGVNNAVSMSTDMLPIKAEDGFWNIMLQRVSSSISGSGTNGYKLAVGKLSTSQPDKFQYFQVVSMSVSGGLVDSYHNGQGDSNFNANQNWLNTGSINAAVSNSLKWGAPVSGGYSGSISNVRTWQTQLSMSSFKEHVLNKPSSIGNTLTSFLDEAVYQYKLQENYLSGSTNLKLTDTGPDKTDSYHINIPETFVTKSMRFTSDQITTTKFQLISTTGRDDDNKILLNPSESVKSNLSATDESNQSIYSPVEGKRTAPQGKVEISVSPANVLNKIILNHIGPTNVANKFGEAKHFTKDYYKEMDDLRVDLFDKTLEIELDINKWIRAQSNTLNNQIIESVKKQLPAHSNTTSVGVLLQPTMLERSKIKEPTPTVATGSAIGHPDIAKIEDISVSIITPEGTSRPGFVEGDHDYMDEFVRPSGEHKDISGEHDYMDEYVETTGEKLGLEGEHSVPDQLVPSATHETIREGKIVSDNIYTPSGEYKEAYAGNATDSADTQLESFINLHDTWGRGFDDTHFPNYAFSASTSPDNPTYRTTTVAEAKYRNVNYVEPNYVFKMVGDVERISGSKPSEVGLGGTKHRTNFTNPKHFDNHEMRDLNKGYTYESHKHIGTNISGTLDGRPVGKTAYFATKSSGDIVYPANHWIHTSDDPMRINFIEGTQNIGGSRFQSDVYEDLSTASFYSVTVTGENQLVVRRGVREVGSDGQVRNR